MRWAQSSKHRATSGNLLDDGVKRYSYDQADRLVAITSTTGLVWSARYDGDGVRLGQMVNGVPVIYTLDLAAPLVTVLAETQLNKRTTYVYGLGDSPLAAHDGAAWTYLTGRDALNSVRQETDAAGQVLAARSFDPYGVVLSGDGGAPFGFTGEYSDSYLKLQWLRARWLNNETGRFITPDTILPDPVNPATLNAYSWVLNNPVRYVDPSGHQGVLPWPDSWQQVWQWIEQVGVATAPVAVAAGPEAVAGAAIATVCVGVPAVALTGFAWSDPNDPDYPVPEEYVAGAMGATYALPGTNTIASNVSSIGIIPSGGDLRRHGLQLGSSTARSDPLEAKPNTEGNRGTTTARRSRMQQHTVESRHGPADMPPANDPKSVTPITLIMITIQQVLEHPDRARLGMARVLVAKGIELLGGVGDQLPK